MTRTEVVTLLNYRLGNRTDLEDRILLEMAFVQDYILEGTGAFLPWFLETEMATSPIMAEEERVALPDDFLAEVEDQALWLYLEDSDENTMIELKKNDYDLLVAKYPGTGRPQQYAIAGSYIIIKPTPDLEYTVKMRYYAKDTPISVSAGENKWLAHAADLVMAETGKIMAENHLLNAALATSFEKAAMIARDRLYKKHEARRHSNRTYGMGED
jgi:hypothetical protein